MLLHCDAVLVRRECSVWDVRQSTKDALIDGVATSRCVVLGEHICMNSLMEKLLEDDAMLSDQLAQWGDEVDGEEDGALRCVALRDARYKESVLIHREGEVVYMAYLPAVTTEQARYEHHVAMSLAALANTDPMGVQLELPRPIEAGRHRLDELLSLISTLIDV